MGLNSIYILKASGKPIGLHNPLDVGQIELICPIRDFGIKNLDNIPTVSYIRHLRNLKHHI